MKRIAILGSTGSIGVSTLTVAEQFPDLLQIVGLSTNTNIDLLREQVRRFSPAAVAVLDQDAGRRFAAELDGATRVYIGEEGIEAFAAETQCDIVLNALVGFAGLRPTMRAIREGRTIALANKETLVVAGAIITQLLKEHGTRILPVDSEHSAVWQCLVGEDPATVRRLILTASGGPFRTTPRDEFDAITVVRALAHPNWRMGKKVTIDSATLMNKGLEVHEARWLFDMPAEKIDVVVHPQSIVHSLVEFTDGSVKAQCGAPDMKLPIAYALLFPHRAPATQSPLTFAAMKELTFEAPDLGKFPCLQLAFDALAAGGTAPAALNAGNEIAVDAFLHERIRFVDIPRVVASTLERVAVLDPTFENIVAVDADARRIAEEFVLDHCTVL